LVGVTATKDATSVTFTFNGPESISFNYQGVTYSKTKPLMLTLNQYEAFQLSVPWCNQGDVTGLYVTSNKPVYVSGGNAAGWIANGMALDHFVDWMPPTSHLGNEYVIHTALDRTYGDILRVAGTFDFILVFDSLIVVSFIQLLLRLI